MLSLCSFAAEKVEFPMDGNLQSAVFKKVSMQDEIFPVGL
jgi:hypothetical protein